MAYATYTTKALVCGTFDKNTADCTYLLFTRDFGMLHASARSAREERSRQRYALQDFSLVRISLIKGKAGWKIGSVESEINFYYKAADKAARGSVVFVTRLLRRFVGGETAHPELFTECVSILQLLKENVDERIFVQMVAAIRVLALLGYVDAEKIPPPLTSAPLTEVSRFHTEKYAKLLDTVYEKAVTVSHL